MSSTELRPKDHVAWQWGYGIAEGLVESIHYEPKTIISKGKPVKRNGTPDNPAIVIRHKSGNPVLKLSSEVQRTSLD